MPVEISGPFGSFIVVPLMDEARPITVQSADGNIVDIALAPDASTVALEPIVALTEPVLAELVAGGTLSDAVTWGSYTPEASTTVRLMSVNGGAFVAYAPETVTAAGDTYQIRETVTAPAGNSQAFDSVTRTVPAEALQPLTFARTDVLWSRTDITFDMEAA